MIAIIFQTIHQLRIQNTKIHLSYNRQRVIGCFYSIPMIIQTEKEAKERRKCNVKLRKKIVHQSRVDPVLASSTKEIIRAPYISAHDFRNQATP